MKLYEKWYISLSTVILVLSAIAGFVGYKFCRLPEVLIASGAALLLLTIVYLFILWSKAIRHATRIANAGRCFVKANCLCVCDIGTKQAELRLCKNGWLVLQDGLDDSPRSYEASVVHQIDRNTLDFFYSGAKQIQTYRFVFNDNLLIKAILQVLEQNHVDIMEGE